MNERFIFLDVDGVLNNGAWAIRMHEHGVRVFRDGLLYEPSLLQLRRIVDETGAAIVVSSSWRLEPGSYDRLRTWLAKYGMAVADSVPDVGGTRADDITAWFRRHPGRYSYAILDDDADMGIHRDHLVKTRFEDGLTAERADACIRMLLRKNAGIWQKLRRAVMNQHGREARGWGRDHPEVTGMDMTADELFFFHAKPAALPLYDAFRAAVLNLPSDIRIEAKKTQISFFTRHMFAAVSFTPVRKAKDRPDPFLTITFGLPYRVESARIDAATQPRPNRWTHHVMIGSEAEIDGELLCWIAEAAAFAGR